MGGNDSVRAKLDATRRDLLDLTTRNRLLSTPRHRSRSKSAEIVGEVAASVYQRLVVDGKSVGFLPALEAPTGDDQMGAAGSPAELRDEEDVSAVTATSRRHTKLQTTMPREKLQSRLLGMYRDARAFEEEQGVNILFLALGFLRWYDSPSSERERHAPLLLIPVSLERRNAVSNFKITYSGDEISANVSLQAKLKEDFNVDLPDVMEDTEDLSICDYFDRVSSVVGGLPRWEVLSDDILLGFFSFSKFLMYRDLDPETWPSGRGIDAHPLIRALLFDEGFRDDGPLCGDDDPIDDLIDPTQMVHVMDADSSQSLAIEEARRGRSMVIQGPPGTGKSQTIVNIIAAAVNEGKTVLFVAEKMAALDVVKRRMDIIGLGDMCLELHSHKAKKKLVINRLAKTLELGRPNQVEVDRLCGELKAVRAELNGHVEAMHRSFLPAGISPYRVIGESVRLRNQGVPLPDFALADPESWTSEQFRDNVNLLGSFTAQIQQIGVPSVHRWRGVTVDSLLPADRDRLVRHLQAAMTRIDQLLAVTRDLSRFMRETVPRSGADTARLARLGLTLVSAPEMDRTCFGSTVWENRRADIADLVKSSVELTRVREELRGVVADAAWSEEVTAARRDLAAYGRSCLRWMHKSYRRAQATLRGILLEAPPKALEERLHILDALISGRKARESVQAHDSLGREAFGTLWRGEGSDSAALLQVESWEAENRHEHGTKRFRQLLTEIADMGQVERLSTEALTQWQLVCRDIQDVFCMVKLDAREAFPQQLTDSSSFVRWQCKACGRKLKARFTLAGQRRECPTCRTPTNIPNVGITVLPLGDIRQRMSEWVDDPESVTRWISYRRLRERMRCAGMAELAALLDMGKIQPRAAASVFHRAYYDALLKEMFHQRPALDQFNGVTHDRILKQFRRLDKRRIDAACREVALAHHSRIPRGGDDLGELGVLRREIHKKRRHLPLRQLLKRAGNAVLRTKPVFMMSPISIAQYLEPGGIEFDVLLIDEASQVRPVDALGAIARAKQIIVVGDDKQLPPTRFFDRIVGDADVDDSDPEGFLASDLESILGLCSAQNVPNRMLRWHYRSRHHSLIAVSNREFYDNKLYVVPSPVEGGSDLGLRFHHVSHGVFDRGRSASNAAEAKVVAQAVMQHAGRSPSSTLGVGTFSVAQRDAVLDELELLRRDQEELEDFFSLKKAEPFFVKNLETIQGDERDVIFISVGYGRDSAGSMSMGFGPLSASGGERRLNVLITRARQRCEVFSSMDAEDIDLRRTSHRGPQALKTFLSYAKTGDFDRPEVTGRGYDSPFEEEVAKAVRQSGFDVTPQVGEAGFFIDLAVNDPERPGRYLLGIECDGASYHSSRSARDRDRLRQEMLEARGWIMHRIWSSDWFHRPRAQLHKVLAAIEAAKTEAVARRRAGAGEGKNTAADLPVSRIERSESSGTHDYRLTAVPYVEASFPVSGTAEPHEAGSDVMSDIVSRIAGIEGPVHFQEISRRVTTLWGLSRAGKRIQAAVEDAIRLGVQKHILTRSGEFVDIRGKKDRPVRDRSEVSSKTLRRAEMLPPEELRKAIRMVTQTHLGVSENEAVTGACRLLGFGSTGQSLRDAILRELKYLVENRRLIERDGKLYVAAAHE